MTLAALVLGDATHHLIDVLAAASPGCFSALTAGDFSTHLELLKLCLHYTPGGIAHATLVL